MKSGKKIGLMLFLLVFVSCRQDVSDLFVPEFEVYVLLPSEGLGDRSFADVIYEGVEAAALEYNFKVNYIVPENQEAADKWIAGIPELAPSVKGSALIIIAGNQYADAVNQLEGVSFENKILLLAGVAKEMDNVASIVYRTYGASYIAGYLSAKLVDGCRAAVVEGFDASFLEEYNAGFTQGVIDAGGTVNPTAYVSSGFDGFEMPDSAYILASKLLASNDLLFALSAGSNFGIINAARNYSGQRYVIGVDADQSWMGLGVVTGSVIKLFGDDILEYIRQFSEGQFDAGSFYRSMKEGKTQFLMNPTVMGNITIPDDLIKKAIEKENLY